MFLHVTTYFMSKCWIRFYFIHQFKIILLEVVVLVVLSYEFLSFLQVVILTMSLPMNHQESAVSAKENVFLILCRIPLPCKLRSRTQLSGSIILLQGCKSIEVGIYFVRFHLQSFTSDAGLGNNALFG